MRSLIIFSLLALPLGTESFAQGPLDQLKNSARGDTLARLPNDQIEGTIWSYRGTLEKGTAAADGAKSLEGQFRTEGEAILAVSRSLKLPTRDEVKGVVDSFRRGKPKAIPLPSGSSQQRLGEYRFLNKNKLRLDFEASTDSNTSDETALNGSMILRRKKDTSSVWIGDYREKEGKKTVRTWQMEVRALED